MTARVALIAGVLAVAVAGCGEDEKPSEPAAQNPVTESPPAYGGIPFGATRAQVEQKLGPDTTGKDDPVIPADAEIGEVHQDTVWRCAGDYRRPGGSDFLRYEGVAYILREEKVCAFVITASGAVTEAGVSIGDELSTAERKYEGLDCGTANEGSEYEPFDYCAGRLGRGVWIWLGGDPIDTIHLSNSKLADD